MPDSNEPGPLEAFLIATRPTLGRTRDGDNAGAIMGAVDMALKEFSRALGPDSRAEAKELWGLYRARAMSGDYGHLLDVTRRWFKLEGD